MKQTWKTTEIERNEIEQRYLAGDSCGKIGKTYNLDESSVASILKTRGVRMRTISETRKRYYLDDTVFDALNEESAYWTGFLMADGGLSRKNQFALCLKWGDLEHVEKFKAFLNSEAPIKKVQVGIKSLQKRYYSAQFYFSSTKFVSVLSRYGMIEGKKRRVCSSEIEGNRHFWRGMIDADGSLWTSGRGRPRFSMCGYEKMMEKFLQFLKPTKPITLRKQGVIYIVDLNGINAVAIARLLYSDAQIYLSRKQKTALDFFDWQPQRKRKLNIRQ